MEIIKNTMALTIPKREEVKTTSKLVIPSRTKTTVKVEKPKPQETREVGLPEHLGGGRYLTAGTGTLIKSPRSQEALPPTGTAERDHIISVALGGTSDIKNLQYLATTREGRQEGKVSVEQKAINDYTSGKITLPQARLLIATKQQQIKGLTPTESEKTTIGQLGNVIKDAFKKVIKPFTAEGRAEADASNKGFDRDKILVAKTASEVLGREIKPSEYSSVVKQLPKEQKDLIDAKSQEKRSEVIAQIATAPIRWTAGSLASLATSYALEKADSNLKYTPKTDAEKLLINDVDVQRLSKQEDLYGLVARGAGVPTALLVGAILENPFLQGTGASKLIKEAIERQIVKQGEKTLSKLGTKEIIKLADDVIKSETKAGKIAKEDADILSREIKGIRVKELPAPESRLLIPERTPQPVKEGAGFTMKETATKEEVKLAKAQSDYSKNLKTYNAKPTADNLAKVKSSKVVLDNVKTQTEQAIKTTPIKVETPKIETTKPVTTEDLKVQVKEPLQPSIPNRIKNEVIEKGLAQDLKGIEDYTEVTFKDQAEKVGQIIDEDPEKAIRIALGKEEPTNGALPESVFIAVKNQAIKKGDTELLIRLATEEGGVAKESTVLGQRIKMLDEQLEDDAFKNINDVIKNRKSSAEKKGLNVSKAKKEEVSKLKDAIKKSAPKKDEWADFLETIKCK